MIYAEDKCLAESPPTFGIEECLDDLSSLDTNEINCTTYHENPSLCGQNDTEVFKSLEMCCACDGGTKSYVNMTQDEVSEID